MVCELIVIRGSGGHGTKFGGHELSILLVMLWLKRRYVVVYEESGSGDPVPSTWDMEWGY